MFSVLIFPGANIVRPYVVTAFNQLPINQDGVLFLIDHPAHPELCPSEFMIIHVYRKRLVEFKINTLNFEHFIPVTAEPYANSFCLI